MIDSTEQTMLGTIVNIVNSSRYSSNLSEKILDAVKQSLPKLVDLNSCTLRDIRDTLVSHNELVGIYVTDDRCEENTSRRLVRCEFWGVPEEFLDCTVRRIYGAVAETIYESDTVYIEVYPKEGVTDGEVFS